MAEEKLSGVVKFFNSKARFGFIRVDSDGSEVYVHAKNCLDEIGDNDKVHFELKEAKRGPEAVNVTKIQ